MKTDPAIETRLGQWGGGGLVTLVPLIPHPLPSRIVLTYCVLLGKQMAFPELPKNQVPVSPEHRGIINT